MTVRPSGSRIGVAFTADQRSSPVARTRKRRIASLGSRVTKRAPARELLEAARGSPASSSISNRSTVTQRRLEQGLARFVAEHLDRGVVRPNSRRPSGAWAVTGIGHAAEDGLELIAGLGRVQAGQLFQSQEVVALRGSARLRAGDVPHHPAVNSGGSAPSTRLIATHAETRCRRRACRPARSGVPASRPRRSQRSGAGRFGDGRAARAVSRAPPALAPIADGAARPKIRSAAALNSTMWPC